MTWDVFPAVTVKLIVLRAAGSEFHFSLVDMSAALTVSDVFLNDILNMNNAVPVPQPGQNSLLASH